MDDRKRAEALELSLRSAWSEGRVAKILAAFAEERRLERERAATLLKRAAQLLSMFPVDSMGFAQAGALVNDIRAAGASAGPAEGLPPAESQGAPTASAIRAEGTPLPEPLREALREAGELLRFGPSWALCDPMWTDRRDKLCGRLAALAAAPSAQPRETPSAELNTRTARSADGLPVVDFDRDALADGSGDFADGTMETPLGGPTGTQASETPAEGEVWDALEGLAEECDGRADAFATPVPPDKKATPDALTAEGAFRDLARDLRALAAAPSAQPRCGVKSILPDGERTCVQHSGRFHVDEHGRMWNPSPCDPPPTPQASETPLEPEFAHTHTETFADAMREFGHAQASETPAEDALRAEVERQRAHADAAERERDLLAGKHAGVFVTERHHREEIAKREATIATLREEVERLRREVEFAWKLPMAKKHRERLRAALSPPQANPQASTTTQGGEG